MGLGLSGLRLGLGQRGGLRWSAASLFGSGEEGAWLPIDLRANHLFQDAAGTTAADAAGEPVALALDQKDGGALSGELHNDPDMQGPTSLYSTVGVSLATVGGGMKSTNNNTYTGRWRSNATLISPTKVYEVTFTISELGGGNTGVFLAVGDAALNNSTPTQPQQTYGFTPTGLGTGTHTFRIYNYTNATLDRYIGIYNRVGGGSAYHVCSHFSVKEVSGRHAIQSTNTSYRPTLRRHAGGTWYLEHDGVDDVLTVSGLTAGNYTVAWRDPDAVAAGLDANGDPTYTEGVAVSGSYSLPDGNLSDVVIIDRALTAAEWARYYRTTHIDYYVDSVGGDDANDGSNPANAFQTLAAAETAALAYGDGVKVGLVAGSHWREDLNLSTLSGASVIGVGDLATDGLPIIDGALVYSGSYDDATARGDGLTNVWSFDVVQTEGEGYQSIWADGQKLNWVASAAAVTPGDFYVSNAGTDNKNFSGTNTIYFRLAGDADPTGAVIEYTDPTRRGNLRIGTNGTAKNLHTTRNFHADGSLVGLFGCLAENCIMSEGVKHESLLGGGTYRKCVGWHPVSDMRTNNIVLEFYAANGTGVDCYYYDCFVKAPVGAGKQAVTCYSGHNQGAGTYYRSVSLIGCTHEGGGCGVFDVVDSLTYDRIYSYNSATGPQPRTNGDGSPAIMTDIQFIVDDATVTPVRGISNLTSVDIIIDGLRCYTANTPSQDAFIFTNGDVTLRNSVIVENSADTFTGVFYGGNNGHAGRTINWSNCIFENRAIGPKLGIFAWWNPGDQTLGAHDNNVYYNANGASGTGIEVVYDGTKYDNVTAFLAALPEPNSVYEDPGIVDPANGDFSTAAPTSNGAGLLRPDAVFTPVQPSLAAAEAWILS